MPFGRGHKDAGKFGEVYEATRKADNGETTINNCNLKYLQAWARWAPRVIAQSLSRQHCFNGVTTDQSLPEDL